MAGLLGPSLVGPLCEPGPSHMGSCTGRSRPVPMPGDDIILSRRPCSHVPGVRLLGSSRGLGMPRGSMGVCVCCEARLCHNRDWGLWGGAEVRGREGVEGSCVYQWWEGVG